MMTDAPLQAWLDLQAAERQVIAPYVRSSVAATLAYELRVVRSGKAGRSETRQNGHVQVPADRATPLGTQVSIHAGPQDQCIVELRLKAPGRQQQQFNFACPN